MSVASEALNPEEEKRDNNREKTMETEAVLFFSTLALSMLASVHMCVCLCVSVCVCVRYARPSFPFLSFSTTEVKQQTSAAAFRSPASSGPSSAPWLSFLCATAHSPTALVSQNSSDEVQSAAEGQMKAER